MGFADDLARFEETTGLKAQTVLRKLVIDIGGSVIQMSPVDTGRFRGNWVIGYNQPNVSNPGTLDRSGTASNARILAGTSTLKLGDVVFITNSLPYAQRLEYGWSKQAPAGMVRVTAARFEQFVNVAATGLR